MDDNITNNMNDAFEFRIKERRNDQDLPVSRNIFFTIMQYLHNSKENISVYRQKTFVRVS